MWIEGMWKICKKCNCAAPYCQNDSLTCPDCGNTRELKNLGTCRCSSCGGKGTIVKETIVPIIKRRRKEELNLMDFLS